MRRHDMPGGIENCRPKGKRISYSSVLVRSEGQTYPNPIRDRTRPVHCVRSMDQYIDPVDVTSMLGLTVDPMDAPDMIMALMSMSEFKEVKDIYEKHVQTMNESRNMMTAYIAMMIQKKSGPRPIEDVARREMNARTSMIKDMTKDMTMSMYSPERYLVSLMSRLTAIEVQATVRQEGMTLDKFDMLRCRMMLHGVTLAKILCSDDIDSEAVRMFLKERNMESGPIADLAWLVTMLKSSTNKQRRMSNAIISTLGATTICNCQAKVFEAIQKYGEESDPVPVSIDDTTEDTGGHAGAGTKRRSVASPIRRSMTTGPGLSPSPGRRSTLSIMTSIRSPPPPPYDPMSGGRYVLDDARIRQW